MVGPARCQLLLFAADEVFFAEMADGFGFTLGCPEGLL
jgi:hypothetical protein